MLYTQTHSYMHTITHKSIHTSFREINFLLSTCRPNFAEVVRTIWQVDRAGYWVLSWSAYRARVHTVLRAQKPCEGVRNCRLLHVWAQWSLYLQPVWHSAILRSAHTLYLCVFL